MSEQYPGGFISKTAPTVSTSSAQGMWTLSQQAGYQKQGIWPIPTGPRTLIVNSACPSSTLKFIIVYLNVTLDNSISCSI